MVETKERSHLLVGLKQLARGQKGRVGTIEVHEVKNCVSTKEEKPIRLLVEVLLDGLSPRHIESTYDQVTTNVLQLAAFGIVVKRVKGNRDVQILGPIDWCMRKVVFVELDLHEFLNLSN